MHEGRSLHHVSKAERSVTWADQIAALSHEKAVRYFNRKEIRGQEFVNPIAEATAQQYCFSSVRLDEHPFQRRRTVDDVFYRLSRISRTISTAALWMP
jgi:hypothetical protein